MPSASVAGGTFHWRASGQAGTLPITSASPVSRKGGTCWSETPSDARVAHSAIAPSAYRLACMAPAVAPARCTCSGVDDTGCVGLLVRVIAGANHRANGGMAESQFARLDLVHPEDVGMDVTAHRQMRGGGRQVLADGEHVDLVLAHVAHHLQDFFVGLAQA